MIGMHNLPASTRERVRAASRLGRVPQRARRSRADGMDPALPVPWMLLVAVCDEATTPRRRHDQTLDRRVATER
jgi:hypothetical protein